MLPEELDYLLARGELPSLAALARDGAEIPFRRPSGAPASFWTTVATGVPPERHGVVALDAVEPLGLSAPLGRTGPLRPWFVGAAAPLGLAEVRPLLSGRRRAWTAWELAARGGAPVAAVNWWGTFPAEPLPGLVLAHGAWQLLAGDGAGAVAPAERTAGIAALARGLAAAPEAPALEAGAPPEEAARVREQALRPDALYRAVAAGEAARGAALVALYLPGADIAADGWRGSALALADLVRGELAAADRWLAEAGAGFGTVALVVDPGRRREGARGGCCWCRVRRTAPGRGPSRSPRRRSAPPSSAPPACRRAPSSRSRRRNAAGPRRRRTCPASASAPPPGPRRRARST
ncbi:MAG: alkaline phosphatase family protein [Thermoanaerobaculia bacterium]|nr:alkaline phosphatase family protein [Thermoanaerobaculia bacterium]